MSALDGGMHSPTTCNESQEKSQMLGLHGVEEFDHSDSSTVDSESEEIESSTESIDFPSDHGNANDNLVSRLWNTLLSFGPGSGRDRHGKRGRGENALVLRNVKNQGSLQKRFASYRRPEAVVQVRIISSPNLQRIPAELEQFVHTTSVCVSGTGLLEFPWPVLLLRELVELDLSHNWGLDKLPRTIGHLRKLKHLDISDCSIGYLPTEMLHLTSLKRLKANDNPHRSPTADVLDKGVAAVMVFLRQRQTDSGKRRDLWARFLAWGGDGLMDEGATVDSLQDIVLRFLLDFHAEFLMKTVLPPRMKRMLIDRKKQQQAVTRVFKCSQCRSHFTTESYFEMHICKR